MVWVTYMFGLILGLILVYLLFSVIGHFVVPNDNPDDFALLILSILGWIILIFCLSTWYISTH